MRDRLIKLIGGFGDDISLCDICKRPSEDCDGCKNEQLAEYLLENGVIVPPCKVGDKVYFIARNSGKPMGVIDEVEIVMIGKIESGFCAKGKLNGIIFDIMPPFEIDNYAFYRTKEEAEQALTCQESRQVEEGGEG